MDSVLVAGPFFSFKIPALCDNITVLCPQCDYSKQVQKPGIALAHIKMLLIFLVLFLLLISDIIAISSQEAPQVSL